MTDCFWCLGVGPPHFRRRKCTPAKFAQHMSALLSFGKGRITDVTDESGAEHNVRSQGGREKKTKLKNEQFVLGVGWMQRGNPFEVGASSSTWRKAGRSSESPVSTSLSTVSRVEYSTFVCCGVRRSNRDKYAHQVIISLPSPASDGTRAGRRWGVQSKPAKRSHGLGNKRPPQKKKKFFHMDN